MRDILAKMREISQNAGFPARLRDGSHLCFKYLGSSVKDTGMTTGISQRVSAAWGNWKRCSAVLCDRRMPVKLKRKVYKTVVRPALLYGAETWATTRGQEARLEVNEMRMLRWMCGVTRRDNIRMNTSEGQQ